MTTKPTNQFLINHRGQTIEYKYDLKIGVSASKGIYKPINTYRLNTTLEELFGDELSKYMDELMLRFPHSFPRDLKTKRFRAILGHGKTLLILLETDISGATVHVLKLWEKPNSDQYIFVEKHYSEIRFKQPCYHLLGAGDTKFCYFENSDQPKFTTATKLLTESLLERRAEAIQFQYDLKKHEHHLAPGDGFYTSEMCFSTSDNQHWTIHFVPRGITVAPIFNGLSSGIAFTNHVSGNPTLTEKAINKALQTFTKL